MSVGNLLRIKIMWVHIDMVYLFNPFILNRPSALKDEFTDGHADCTSCKHRKDNEHWSEPINSHCTKDTAKDWPKGDLMERFQIFLEKFIDQMNTKPESNTRN